MYLLNRYVIGFLFAVGLVVLILVLLLSGPSTPKTVTKSLLSYADSNSSVELDIYGPIVAPSNHNEIDIVINQTYSNITVYQGYNYNAVKSANYSNSYNSYKAFLAALNFAGFNTGTKNNASSLGYCAEGDVYTYKLYNNGQEVSSYWSSGCSNDPITYRGDVARTLSLFQAQIPDYSSIVSNANI